MSVTTINTRNQFRGVSAVITSSSIDRLNLRVGDNALALFKATEVLIAKIGDAAA